MKYLGTYDATQLQLNTKIRKNEQIFPQNAIIHESNKQTIKIQSQTLSNADINDSDIKDQQLSFGLNDLSSLEGADID